MIVFLRLPGYMAHYREAMGEWSCTVPLIIVY